jgi:glutaredoxin
LPSTTTRRWATSGLVAVLGLLAIVFGISAAPQAAANVAVDAPAVVATAVEATSSPLAASGKAQVTVYGLDTCGHCHRLKEWLAGRDDVEVTFHEVSNQASMSTFVAHAERLGFDPRGVPVTIVGDRYWIGFGDDTRDAIGRAIEAEARDWGDQPQVGESGAEAGEDRPVISVPLVGDVDLGGSSLFAASALIGFVDGFNPCSLWVLSVLLAIVLRTGSRRRVLAIGSAFLLTTGAMYALFMAGIYSAMTVIGHLGWIQAVVGVVALVFGVVSIRDYLGRKSGISLSIRESSKPGIYQRMRAVVARRRLLPALAATAGLAVLVSLLETPCTAGFPVLWTGMLHAHGVGPAQAAFYFLVYMVPFLLDEFVIFLVAVLTMRAAKMQEKHGQLLKLFSGVVMLFLAGAMLLRPALMQDPLQALGLFAVAAVATALVHGVTRRVRAAR